MKDIAPYLFIGTFVVLLVGGVVSWCFTAFYMVKTLNRFHPERTWGKYVPLSLFTPWFFTDEGNEYRLKLLKAGGVFLLLVGIGLTVGFLQER